MSQDPAVNQLTQSMAQASVSRKLSDHNHNLINMWFWSWGVGPQSDLDFDSISTLSTLAYERLPRDDSTPFLCWRSSVVVTDQNQLDELCEFFNQDARWVVIHRSHQTRNVPVKLSSLNWLIPPGFPDRHHFGKGEEVFITFVRGLVDDCKSPLTQLPENIFGLQPRSELSAYLIEIIDVMRRTLSGELPSHLISTYAGILDLSREVLNIHYDGRVWEFHGGGLYCRGEGDLFNMKYTITLHSAIHEQITELMTFFGQDKHWSIASGQEFRKATVDIYFKAKLDEKFKHRLLCK